MPMPNIMASARCCSSVAQQRFHIAHRLGQSVDDRARDDRMADVQFDDFRDRGDRLDVVVVEAMTGIHRQAQRGRRFRRAAQPLEFARARRPRGLGIGAGMQLDYRRSRRGAPPRFAPDPDR